MSAPTAAQHDWPRCACTSSPARAAPASPRSPPPWPWRWPRTARTCCSARSRAARASPGCSTSTRCPTRSAGSPPACAATARRRASCYALHIDPESALLEYLAMYYKLGRAGRALDRFGVIEFATTIAPGVRDVLLTGKVFEAVQRNSRNKARDPVRRRRARRAADRPDHPVPQRQRRAGRAGQGRPDQEPGRHGDDAVPLAADRRPPGHRARGDAGAGDRRRHRRAAQGRGCPSGGVVVNLVRPRDLGGRRPRRRAGGPARRRADRGRPRGGRGRAPAPTWSTACSPRRATTPSDAPSRTPSARWSPASGVPTYELPRLAGGVDLGGLYELAGRLERQGLA